MNRLRSITREYPFYLVIKIKTMQKKNLFKPWQASAISTSYSFLGIKTIPVLWTENNIK